MNKIRFPSEAELAAYAAQAFEKDHDFHCLEQAKKQQIIHLVAKAFKNDTHSDAGVYTRLLTAFDVEQINFPITKIVKILYQINPDYKPQTLPGKDELLTYLRNYPLAPYADEKGMLQAIANALANTPVLDFEENFAKVQASKQEWQTEGFRRFFQSLKFYLEDVVISITQQSEPH